MIGPLIPIPKGQKGAILKGWSTLSPDDLNRLMEKHRGNVGLRLDHYAVLDPDSKAAGSLCDTWEREGRFPRTWTFRTARGAIKRIFNRPDELTSKIEIPVIKFELRAGSGLYDVLPPSYVKENGIDGAYAWLPDLDPESIEPAPLPESVLSYFLTHSSKTLSSTSALKSKDHANRLDFFKGGRDDSLFHLATCLRKGGMMRGDAEQVLIAIAKNCSPPFSEKDALKKIESAYKRESLEINLAAEAREWVLSSSGVFVSADFVKEAGLSSMSTDRKFGKNLSKIFERLVKDGEIERHGDRRGQFRRIEKDSQVIDFLNADCSTIFDLKWPSPFHLDRLVNIYPKNIIMVAGASNAGKTGLLLNLVRENMGQHRINYFSSEMGAEELRLRLEKFEMPINQWKFEARERAGNFADGIDPGAVNIIDYFELTDNFYQVGGEIKKIFDKLTTGIAIIAIQKKEGQDLGRGGAFTLEKARLYISMDAGELKVVKGKNWARPGHNPNGKIFKFKLVDGCKFIQA